MGRAETKAGAGEAVATESERGSPASAPPRLKPSSREEEPTTERGLTPMTIPVVPPIPATVVSVAIAPVRNGEGEVMLQRTEGMGKREADKMIIWDGNCRLAASRRSGGPRILTVR